MPVISLIFEEPAWPDIGHSNPEEIEQMLKDGSLVWMAEGTPPIQITCLEQGMYSGKPSVAMRFDLPDGKIVVVETSLRLFLVAADALKAKYGDPRE